MFRFTLFTAVMFMRPRVQHGHDQHELPDNRSQSISVRIEVFAQLALTCFVRAVVFDIHTDGEAHNQPMIRAFFTLNHTSLDPDQPLVLSFTIEA